MMLAKVWGWYLVTVTVAVGWLAPSAAGGQAQVFCAVQLAMLAILAVAYLSAHRSPRASTIAMAIFSAVGLPIVFSSLGLVLPAVHPEPYEWAWIAWDRAAFGTDPSVALQTLLAPWFTEILQWIYASFYAIPVFAIAILGWRHGQPAFDRALTIVAFCFLLSYLGYLLWPTLPPYRFLPHGEPLQGVWLAEHIHQALDQAEVHHWDCFPSGHTMLTLVSAALLWRDARPWFWILLPVVVLLILSTMALRYHYFCDVVAGAVGAALGAWLAARLTPRQADCENPTTVHYDA